MNPNDPTPNPDTEPKDSAAPKVADSSKAGRDESPGDEPSLFPQPEGLLELAHAEAGQARRLFEVIRLVARDLLFSSPLPRMAAALAFRTIFGLIPIAVLGLVVLGEVISDEQLESEISRLLEFTGITQLVSEDRSELIERQIEAERNGVQPVPPGAQTPTPANRTPAPTSGAGTERGRVDPPQPRPESPVAPEKTSPQNPRAPPASQSGPAGPNEAGAAQTESSGFVTDTEDGLAGVSSRPQQLDAWIRQIIIQVRDVSLRAIGLVGVLVLVYAAFTLIREIERCFNQIYDTAVSRSWLSSVFVYWTTITLGGLLLLGTFYVGDWIARQLADGLIGRGAIELGINSLVTLVLLTLAYIGLPNTRVNIHTALGGAFVATVLWQVLKFAFRLYLQAATGYERLYGEIGLIPLFLFWIYLTWLVILFGLQVSFALQTFSVWRERKLRARATHADFVDPAALLAVAVALARRFDAGTSATMYELARAAGVGEAAAADLLDALEDAGIAQRLRDQDDQARFTLARPAERVETPALFQIAASLAPCSDEADESGLLRALAAMRQERWRGSTLRDLMHLGESALNVGKSIPQRPNKAHAGSVMDSSRAPH